MTRGFEGWTPDRAMDATIVAPILRAEGEAIAVLVAALEERTDGYQDAEVETEDMSRTLRRLLGVAAISGLLTSAGASASRRSSRHWERRARGLELPTRAAAQAIVAAWVADNTVRLTSLVTSAGPRVTRALGLAQRAGKSPTTFARELERVGLPVINGRLRGRGAVIARDQLSTLAGQLAEDQQRAAGVTQYIWRTKGDSRVRHRHADREGKRFSWSSPPSDGHPGQPINCRCHAEAVVDARLSSTLRAVLAAEAIALSAELS